MRLCEKKKRRKEKRRKCLISKMYDSLNLDAWKQHADINQTEREVNEEKKEKEKRKWWSLWYCELDTQRKQNAPKKYLNIK